MLVLTSEHLLANGGEPFVIEVCRVLAGDIQPNLLALALVTAWIAGHADVRIATETEAHAGIAANRSFAERCGNGRYESAILTAMVDVLSR
jgi:DNA-binding PucR family transcriptional regulator